MSKRELGQLSGGNDVDGPRSKRRREVAQPNAGGSSDVDALHSDPVIPDDEETGAGGSMSQEEVREAGLKLWQTARDAVNKDGREMALAFLKKPPKKLYPDYYQLIKQPIAFDDIKKSIEGKKYSTLEEIRQDFELCFKNATTYNMPESEIYVDAEQLLKLVNKTVKKLSPSDEPKAPSLNRLIKQKLQKLIDKADDEGRVLSTIFMELPSKKEWPIYYKEIKKPQCLDNISKKIKRKEYATAGEFAADVELVFSNALQFNQEHTQIWEDAKTLKDTFRASMADMPAPFAIPEYVKPSAGKLKITMPARPAATVPKLTLPAAAPQKSEAPTVTIPPLKVHVPPKAPPKPSSPPKPPAVTPTPPPVPSAAPVEPIPPPVITAPPPVPVPAPQAPTPQYAASPIPTATHYPNAVYATRQATHSPAITAPATSAYPSPTVAAPKTIAKVQSATQSPVPSSAHPLKSVALNIKPRKRTLMLDHRDGVKCWALRLVPGETEILVDQIVFNADEGEDSDAEEEEEAEGANNEEDDRMEVDGPTKNLRSKGKGRAKGRVKEKAKTKMQPEKKQKSKPGPIQVKFNSTVVAEESADSGTWLVRPTVGTSVLEIGENGGLFWKSHVSSAQFKSESLKYMKLGAEVPVTVRSIGARNDATANQGFVIDQYFFSSSSMRTRCRNFTREGKPKEGWTCRPDCPFVHPDSNDWFRAPEYMFNQDRGGGRGRGRGRGRGGGYQDRGRDYSADRSSSYSSSRNHDDTVWDPKSWGGGSYSEAGQSSSNSLQRRRDSTGEASKTTRDHSSSTGWGGGGSGGWGSSSNTGWDDKGGAGNNSNTTNNGWGSWGTSESSNTSNGWGASGGSSSVSGTDKGWGSAETIEKVTTASSKGWGTTTPIDTKDTGSESTSNSKEPFSSGWGVSSSTSSSQAAGSTSKVAETSSSSGWGTSVVPDKKMASSGWGSSSNTEAQPKSSGWGTPPVTEASSGRGSKSNTEAQPKSSGWGTPPVTEASSGWGSKSITEAQPKSSGWGTPPVTETSHSTQSGWGLPAPLDAQNPLTPSSVHNNVPMSPLPIDGSKHLPYAGSSVSSLDKSTENASLRAKQGGWPTRVESQDEQNGDMEVDHTEGPSTKLTSDAFNRNTNTGHIPSPPASPFRTTTYEPLSPRSRPLAIETDVLNYSSDDQNSLPLNTPYTPNSITPASEMVPMTRSQAFVWYIKNLIGAIWYEREAKLLETKKNDWNNAQRSSEYSRISPKVARILDRERRGLNGSLMDRQKRLGDKIHLFTTTPNFDDPVFLPEFDVREIESYIAQLQVWIEEGKLYQRLIARESSTPQQKQRDTPDDATSDNPEDNVPDSIQEILDATEKLENTYGRLVDVMHLKEYTTILDDTTDVASQPRLEPAFGRISAAIETKRLLLEINERKDTVAQTISEQMNLVSDLMNKSTALDEEIQAINEKLDARKVIQQKAEESLSRIEQWQKEDEQKIEELERKLQILREAPEPPPPSIQPNALLPILRNIISEQYRPECQGYLTALQEAAEKCHQQSVADLTAQLQRTLEVTNHLHTRAREITGSANTGGTANNIANIANASKAH